MLARIPCMPDVSMKVFSLGLLSFGSPSTDANSGNGSPSVWSDLISGFGQPAHGNAALVA